MDELIQKTLFCKYCGRMNLHFNDRFEFYDMSTGAELIRDAKICDVCGTVHFLEYPNSPYISFSTLYLIKFYSDNGTDCDYEKVDAKANKIEFYENGKTFNGTGGAILKRPNVKNKLRKYSKSYYDGEVYYHEVSEDKKPEEKPKKSFKIIENQHTVKINGNLSKFTL